MPSSEHGSSVCRASRLQSLDQSRMRTLKRRRDRIEKRLEDRAARTNRRLMDLLPRLEQAARQCPRRCLLRKPPHRDFMHLTNSSEEVRPSLQTRLNLPSNTHTKMDPLAGATLLTVC